MTKENSLLINNINISYTDSQNGFPVIFQHGYTNSKKVWAELIPFLINDYRCITFDSRGCGESDRPQEGFTLDGYVSDIIAIADTLGIEKFNFVGHSMGGLIGMWLACKIPERINKMILIAPAPSNGINDGLLFEDMMKRNRKIRKDQDIDILIQERIRTSSMPITEQQARERSYDFLDVSDEHFEQSGQMILNANIQTHLKEILNDVLYIAGAADFLIKDNLKDYLLMRNATLHVFSRIGHSIPREIPKECALVMKDFFKHGVVNFKTLNNNKR